MLTLEIEFLSGVYRASLPDGSGAEWPPHPERVFSALVQAWGDGGENAQERTALTWLESLDPPEIEATAARTRDVPRVYVPPNDKTELPEHRRRQERTFFACIPDEPRVRLTWSGTPTAETMTALEALAHRVASLGHSSSLVRFTFHTGPRRPFGDTWRPSPEGKHPLRAIYPGRLADLERWHSRAERPRTRRTVTYAPSAQVPAPRARSVFGGAESWFVFEHAVGFRPDLLAFGHVARRMRHALMQSGPQPVPEILSGHASDGGPSQAPHLAIVPLADVGWSHSKGDLLGFALVLPRNASPLERETVIEALTRLTSLGEDGAARIHLRLTRRDTWMVEHAPWPSRASLRPRRYCARARVWQSVTPVFIDRFPKAGDAREEAEILAASCTALGLPEPVEIEIHKYSAVSAAPPAYPRRRPGQPDWSIPRDARFVERPRRHAVLRFGEPIEGPLILGAGRYHGFGLFLPLREDSP